MPRLPLTFRVRRFFGLTNGELCWISALDADESLYDQISYGLLRDILTPSTAKVCCEFLDSFPEVPPEETGFLLSALVHHLWS